jgi:hypothetical protein
VKIVAGRSEEKAVRIVAGRTEEKAARIVAGRRKGMEDGGRQN